MTRALSHGRRYTVDEYFQIDTGAEVRHEYVDGEIMDMAGLRRAQSSRGTGPHSQIIANVIGSTWSRLRGKPCRVMDSNVRVRCGRRVQYGYADALIVCGPPEYDPAGPRETKLLNPRVLIEVLSESTEGYDRGLKFERHREIESFAEYVLIATDRPSVDVHRRQPSGLWALQPYGGLGATASIESAGIELPLAEVYAGITFPPDPEAEPAAPQES